MMAAAPTHRYIVFDRGSGYPARHVPAHLDPLLHIGETLNRIEGTRSLLAGQTPNAEQGRGIGHLPPREWPECARQSCAAVWRACREPRWSHRGEQPSKTSDLREQRAGTSPRPRTVLNESGCPYGYLRISPWYRWRGARHRARLSDWPWPSPITRIISHNRTAPGLGHQAPAVSGHGNASGAYAILHLKSAFGSGRTGLSTSQSSQEWHFFRVNERPG